MHISKSSRFDILSTNATETIFRTNHDRLIFYIKAVPDRVNTVNKLERIFVENSSRLVKVDNIKIRWQFDPKRFGKVGKYL